MISWIFGLSTVLRFALISAVAAPLIYGFAYVHGRWDASDAAKVRNLQNRVAYLQHQLKEREADEAGAAVEAMEVERHNDELPIAPAIEGIPDGPGCMSPDLLRELRKLR